ncbi:TPA: signal peptidase I [Patescibacteria group bacterium]|nr:signal peptidase I [Patescibacteria group bacterium]
MKMLLLRFFRTIFHFFFDVLESIVVALAIFVVVYLFLYQPHQVKGASMEPNFHDGEYILTNKFVYKFEDPHRGDVIVFKSPQNPDIDFIKRIIGTPGDHVKLQNNHFYVNNQLLGELYIADELYTYYGNFLKEGAEIIIPQDYYFVVGDNRPRSSDSREWGPIDKSAIIGKSQFRYWPLNRAGLIQDPQY